MRRIKLASLAAYCRERFAAKECRLKRIANSAGHLIIFSVILLMSSEVCADNPDPPQVNLWYGNYQTFGANGVPQQWVNILGKRHQRCWNCNAHLFPQLRTPSQSELGATKPPLG